MRAQIEQFEEKDHVIDIAYDKKRQHYIGYNADSALLGIGVDVESAKMAYINAHYSRLAELEYTE